MKTLNQEKTLQNIEISILDLVPVLENGSASQSIRNSLDLAQKAESFGYNRYWLAEHHNMAGIASSATSVLIGYIAGGTSTIKVGSGGIMLPNHAPLIVAEQFGTLESIYPGRIELGLGRAPGTDQVTSMALRRHMKGSVEEFPQNVQEIRGYFSNTNPKAPVRALPGEGLSIPVWLLGSSTYSAQLAAMLGLPFAFASHFAPAMLHNAIKLYRDNFVPSDSLQKPYLMAGVNVIAADTDEEADYLATSLFAFFLNVIRGTANPLRPPVENMDAVWNESEQMAIRQMLAYTFIGGPATIEKKLNQFISETGIDELMIVTNIFDHEERIKSYRIVAELKDAMAVPSIQEMNKGYIQA